MVLKRLQPLDSEVFTKEVFESAPNDAAKGRMAESYILQCFIKHRYLTLPLYPVGGDTRDNRLDRSRSWIASEEAIESDSEDGSTLHYQLVRPLLDLTSHMIVV